MSGMVAIELLLPGRSRTGIEVVAGADDELRLRQTGHGCHRCRDCALIPLALPSPVANLRTSLNLDEAGGLQLGTDQGIVGTGEGGLCGVMAHRKEADAVV